MLFDDPSLTMHEKGVLPSGKVEPDGGAQTGAPIPGQLSDTTGSNVTGAPAGLVHSTTGVGHEISGSCWSSTVTFALQVADVVSGSVTVRVTAVVPNEYGGGGAWLRVTGSPSASDEPSSIEAADAVQTFGSVGTVTSVHFASGGVPGKHGLSIVVPYCAA